MFNQNYSIKTYKGGGGRNGFRGVVAVVLGGMRLLTKQSISPTLIHTDRSGDESSVDINTLRRKVTGATKQPKNKKPVSYQ